VEVDNVFVIPDYLVSYLQIFCYVEAMSAAICSYLKALGHACVAEAEEIREQGGWGWGALAAGCTATAVAVVVVCAACAAYRRWYLPAAHWCQCPEARDPIVRTAVGGVPLLDLTRTR
jgi:hypothetical protein